MIKAWFVTRLSRLCKEAINPTSITLCVNRLFMLAVNDKLSPVITAHTRKLEILIQHSPLC